MIRRSVGNPLRKYVAGVRKSLHPTWWWPRRGPARGTFGPLLRLEDDDDAALAQRVEDAVVSLSRRFKTARQRSLNGCVAVPLLSMLAMRSDRPLATLPCKRPPGALT